MTKDIASDFSLINYCFQVPTYKLMGICSYDAEYFWQPIYALSHFLYHNIEPLVTWGTHRAYLRNPDFEHAVPLTWNSLPLSCLSCKFIFHLSDIFSGVAFSLWFPWYHSIPITPRKLNLFSSVNYNYLYVDSSTRLRVSFWNQEMCHIHLCLLNT